MSAWTKNAAGVLAVFAVGALCGWMSAIWQLPERFGITRAVTFYRGGWPQRRYRMVDEATRWQNGHFPNYTGFESFMPFVVEIPAGEWVIADSAYYRLGIPKWAQDMGIKPDKVGLVRIGDDLGAKKEAE
jgi:hypothetical protein